ncbi:MAG: O-antigen ligase family protein [Actinobacteria bacterium]|nr:O-antigen ligase family protein [Actinomycetota bacterium]
MTTVARRRTPERGAPVDFTTLRRPMVDVLAPAVLVAWLVIYFEPFLLRFPLPGAASSVLFPAMCVVTLLLTPKERIRSVPVLWSLLLVVVVLALSVLWTEDPGATLFRIRADLPGTLLVAAVAGTMPPTKVVRTLALASTAIAAISLLASLGLTESREAPFDEAYLGVQNGFRGLFIHKNELGMFLVYGLCAVLVQPKSSSRTAAIVVHLVTILGTRSASVGGGLLAVAFVWLWLSALRRQEKPRERTFLLVMSIASAVLGVLLVLGLLPVLLDLYDKDVTFSGRTFIWAASLDAIRDRPWLGYGMAGIWMDETNPVTADLHARIGFKAAHAHNGALDLTLQVGLVGLAAYTTLVWQALRGAVRAMAHRSTAAVGQWAVLVVSSLLLMSIAENVFLGPYLGLLAVVATVAGKAAIEGDPLGSRRPAYRRLLHGTRVDPGSEASLWA